MTKVGGGERGRERKKDAYDTASQPVVHPVFPQLRWLTYREEKMEQTVNVARWIDGWMTMTDFFFHGKLSDSRE